jgi:hypothetical protein
MTSTILSDAECLALAQRFLASDTLTVAALAEESHVSARTLSVALRRGGVTEWLHLQHTHRVKRATRMAMIEVEA